MSQSARGIVPLLAHLDRWSSVPTLVTVQRMQSKGTKHNLSKLPSILGEIHQFFLTMINEWISCSFMKYCLYMKRKKWEVKLTLKYGRLSGDRSGSNGLYCRLNSGSRNEGSWGESSAGSGTHRSWGRRRYWSLEGHALLEGSTDADWLSELNGGRGEGTRSSGDAGEPAWK